MKTERTFRSPSNSNIIFGFLVTKKMLDEIDGSKRTHAVIIVPWKNKEVEEWVQTWNPNIIGEKQIDVEEVIINPVVEEGLKTIPSHNNLYHPSDKDMAVELLKRLHENGELFDPISVRVWAVRNGWSPEGADNMKDIAQGVIDKKRFRKSPSPIFRDDIIEVLRGRVQNNE